MSPADLLPLGRYLCHMINHVLPQSHQEVEFLFIALSGLAFGDTSTLFLTESRRISMQHERLTYPIECICPPGNAFATFSD